MTSQHLSIGEMSRLCGVSTHTLRFYEAEGILLPATRAANGHRRYRRDDVLWLEFVLRLKLTGMPLADIRTYADLRLRGDGTLRERLRMLKVHRQRLADRIEALTTSASALDDKIDIYLDMIAERGAREEGTPHDTDDTTPHERSL
ncbi:MerR family transcriptional regulator [Nitrogeniibacter aestuarii]|uniref:MerR family transcriptional regulator n=1 Tax=Nitrogeniibacter aestuarii TaxID=2815343 RepID=UPI001D1182CE|nr:MerR family transcriptional regulator [Nitrogeniibacter aestuarii]